MAMIPIYTLSFLLFFLLLFTSSTSTSTSTSSSSSSSSSSSISVDGDTTKEEEQPWIVVDFQNFHRHLVYLWWEGSKLGFPEDISLGPLDSGGRTSLNTTIGHSFYITKEETTTDEDEDEDEDDEIEKLSAPIVIEKGKTTYTFNEKVNIIRIKSLPSQVVPLNENIKSPALETIGLNSVRIRSLLTEDCLLWFNLTSIGDGSIIKDPIFQKKMSPGEDYYVNTIAGHVFYATKLKVKKGHVKIGNSITIVKSKSLYFIQSDDNIINENHKNDFAEAAFLEKYYNKTGIYWRHYFDNETKKPRPKPSLHIWSADYIGQIHNVESKQGFWSCNNQVSSSTSTSTSTSPPCQLTTIPIDFELQVISIKPKIFYVKQFLSDFEVSELIRIAKPNLHKSGVGLKMDDGSDNNKMRSSLNTWIRRKSSKITESLFLRVGDILQIKEEIILSDFNAEDIQVVNYQVGMEYQAHHDYGVGPFPESRLVTVLLYLTDMPSSVAGGETAFPEAYYYSEDNLPGSKKRDKRGPTKGIKIQPAKGSAVIFYNMLEDGNVDELSLHAALPVLEGEKWLANFWVWDPKRTKDAIPK